MAQRLRPGRGLDTNWVWKPNSSRQVTGDNWEKPSRRSVFLRQQEFQQLFYTVVYIQPRANASAAAQLIADTTHKLDEICPDAPKFILGDFNKCDLGGAYRSIPMPALGASYHNSVYLMPVYKPSFMRLEHKERTRTPISHKVIEKRRRDRIIRCPNELGKTVPMAMAKQPSGKLEKAEILEMTVQYLRALHTVDFPSGREKGELLAEFANYFHYGYHECMKNLVHYLNTEDRAETKDIKYARILAFLQSESCVVTEPVFYGARTVSKSPNILFWLHTSDSVYKQSPPGHFSWHSSARSPAITYPTEPLSAHSQQHGGYLSPLQGLDHHYFNFIGHTHANTFSLQSAQHAM
ncbi:hairy and enhancer of split-related protein helt-like [Pleuronectes platessa]|uniref:hairy and enhancer of split-related protein helt-like n=1 Tax=Pleuronectes platessa TaxID=8262 RepID=UPI00232A67F0|nr:hairy and enhancer of split-related protein helt-like [Pleuronectes platessa]